MQLGPDQIFLLSPDEASAKAARGLVIPAKWPRLEFNDDAVWGECQGSGSKPYQVQVDKLGPAFRCSCPSRKFPCKHGLALLLLLAQHAGKFSEATPPPWVGEWLESRRQRAEKQAEKQERKKTEAVMGPDPQAVAARETARTERMASGLRDLSRWLGDRLRQGLAQMPADVAAWDGMATRMVDAQMPGVAYRLRQIGAVVGQGSAWPEKVLGAMGRMQLLIDAFERLQELPPGLQADVRHALGMNTERDVVMANGEQVADHWFVEAQAFEEENRLYSRRVWLYGKNSARRALLLDYAHGSRRFEQSWVPGSTVAMALAFFPGALPLRALVVGDQSMQPSGAMPTLGLDAALDALADAVAANPWQSPLPLRLDDGVPVSDAWGWGLQVGDRRLSLAIRDEDGWQLLAEAGGAPLSVFGEWDGEALRPLSAWRNGLVWLEEVSCE